MAAGLGKGGGNRPPRTLVILSDGTGNSASAMFKTNVWRIYQAIDQSEPPPAAPRQIAYYDDGVGTSSFRPLALLGGIFGVGLKRNVLDLYRFICRNYQPGDSIYAFGFSRGAFTIRTTIGLLAREGIVQCSTEEELSRASTDAYRAIRRCIQPTPWYVRGLRNIRDGIIGVKRGARGERPYAAIPKHRLRPHPRQEIKFVGVFDTVAAYGLPVSELTRGIDRWVWPLSMPNYVLSEKVKAARHALALDDERDTFHPLVWDEVEEALLVEKGSVEPGRLLQVWFNGMHSDIGGGYPDDSLAYGPLLWMIEEAQKFGLRFKPVEVQDYALAANRFGPLHDSRGGLASYYRLQPRKLSAKLDPPDPKTLLTQDPELKGRGLLASINIHESVFDRITKGFDWAAPIVLPAAYQVVQANGSLAPPPEPNPALRADRQEWIWNDVWRRRANYFMIVCVTLILALFPFLPINDTPSCIGPECLVVPVISAVGTLLPAFADLWVDAFAGSPGWFLILAILLLLLIKRGNALRRRINDGMRELWDQSLGPPAQRAAAGGRAKTKAGRALGLPNNFIFKLRSSRAYQRTLQALKWRLVPGFFGISVLVLACVAIVGSILRVGIETTNLSPGFCGSDSAASEAGAGARRFTTNSICWPTGEPVEEGQRYQLSFQVGQPWHDVAPAVGGACPTERIAASPFGFRRDEFAWYVRHLSLLIRRSFLNKWFQPHVAIVPDGFGVTHTQAVAMVRDKGDDTLFTGEFTASQDGALYLFVNEAVLPIPGLTSMFYECNQGDAAVTVAPAKQPE